MRMSRPFCLALVLGLLAEPGVAVAYIDPGTGSALFYMVTSLVVSAYFAARGFYYRFLDLVFRIRFRHTSCSIAIHCEDPRYEITFLPIIRHLAVQGIAPTLFTMYERDSSFEPLPAEVTHRAIPPGMVGYAYLNNIEATVLVTTTPQLDVMTFRRSRRVRSYVMVQHALGESRFVRPYAYDYFDVVLCCGEVLKKNIRRMEALRASRSKELLDTGLPHYEALIAARKVASNRAGRTCVLVAPSWGPLSMFEAYGTNFIAQVAEKFDVIVRPHPQMRVSQPELYAKILATTGVEIDTSRTPSSAMSRADILLSDISGIAHEFAFIYERPVVVIDRHLELGGLEGELLGGDSEVKQRCADFIVSLPGGRLNEVSDELARVLLSHKPERLRHVRDELIYNFGHASEVAARQLAQIYTRERARSHSGREVTETVGQES